MKLKLAKGGVEFVEHLHQVFEGLVEHDIFSKTFLRDGRRIITSILKSL